MNRTPVMLVVSMILVPMVISCGGTTGVVVASADEDARLVHNGRIRDIRTGRDLPEGDSIRTGDGGARLEIPSGVITVRPASRVRLDASAGPLTVVVVEEGAALIDLDRGPGAVVVAGPSAYAVIPARQGSSAVFGVAEDGANFISVTRGSADVRYGLGSAVTIPGGREVEISAEGGAGAVHGAILGSEEGRIMWTEARRNSLERRAGSIIPVLERSIGAAGSRYSSLGSGARETAASVREAYNEERRGRMSEADAGEAYSEGWDLYIEAAGIRGEALAAIFTARGLSRVFSTGEEDVERAAEDFRDETRNFSGDLERLKDALERAGWSE